jgi:hypothetical protein
MFLNVSLTTPEGGNERGERGRAFVDFLVSQLAPSGEWPIESNVDSSDGFFSFGIAHQAHSSADRMQIFVLARCRTHAGYECAAIDSRLSLRWAWARGRQGIGVTSEIERGRLSGLHATYGTPTWIWSVVVDGALYVRPYNGPDSRWYQARSGRGLGASPSPA